MKLEITPGTGCSAMLEGSVVGSSDGYVFAEIEIGCERCDLCTTQSVQGDIDSANKDLQTLFLKTLEAQPQQCGALIEKEIDSDSAPEGFFPSVRIVGL
jgi:hypothetical protein